MTSPHSILLMIVLQKMCKLIRGALQRAQIRQIDDPEMIRNRPVEASSVHDKDALLMQELGLDGDALFASLRAALPERLERKYGLNCFFQEH